MRVVHFSEPACLDAWDCTSQQDAIWKKPLPYHRASSHRQVKHLANTMKGYTCKVHWSSGALAAWKGQSRQHRADLLLLGIFDRVQMCSTRCTAVAVLQKEVPRVSILRCSLGKAACRDPEPARGLLLASWLSQIQLLWALFRSHPAISASGQLAQKAITPSQQSSHYHAWWAQWQRLQKQTNKKTNL